MAIDLHAEHLLKLGEASRTLPNRPCPSTIWRWHRQGIRGIKLETVCVGGTRFTSREALTRFATALTAADEPHVEPVERSAETTARLQRAGLLDAEVGR